MKRIGIVTLSNSINYGGVLQAVALKKAIERIGVCPINITCQKMPSTWKSPIGYVRKRIKLYGSKGILCKFRICAGFCKTLLSNMYFFSAKTKNTVYYPEQMLKKTSPEINY